jgi:hypothetical protein
MRTDTATALVALSLAGCAAPRASFGHLDLRAVHPTPLFERQHTSLKIEDGRIAATSPVEGAPAELWLADDGCVHLYFRARGAALCPTTTADGARTYAGPLGLSYSPQLLESGARLRVVIDGTFADVELGADPASTEVRRHPELLGAAVRLGALPRSEDGLYKAVFSE